MYKNWVLIWCQHWFLYHLRLNRRFPVDLTTIFILWLLYLFMKFIITFLQWFKMVCRLHIFNGHITYHCARLTISICLTVQSNEEKATKKISATSISYKTFPLYQFSDNYRMQLTIYNPMNFMQVHFQSLTTFIHPICPQSVIRFWALPIPIRSSSLWLHIYWTPKMQYFKTKQDQIGCMLYLICLAKQKPNLISMRFVFPRSPRLGLYHRITGTTAVSGTYISD